MRTSVALQKHPEPVHKIPAKPHAKVEDVEEVIDGPSAPVVKPVVVEAVLSSRVKLTKRKLAFKSGLKAKVNQMREGGFDKKDFDGLLKKYSLEQVLDLVAGENEIDGLNLRDQMEQITFDMLAGQAARFAANNPVIN